MVALRVWDDWKKLTIEPVDVCVLVIHRGGSHCDDCDTLIRDSLFCSAMQSDSGFAVAGGRKVMADADRALCG